MYVVKLINHRILSDDEFNALKNTSAMSAMLENRMRLLVPPGEGSSGAFSRSVRDWIHNNASSLAYIKMLQINSAVHLDVYFRSKTDAAGFKLFWAERTWGD